MGRLFGAALGVTSVFAIALSTTACGTDATAPDACRKIEQARCRRAAACPELGVKGAVGVEECTQYARDRCLHGLGVADPGPPAVDACVTAIEQATCDVVAAPETAAACAFLKPTPGSVDAGPDGSSDDASDLDAAAGDGG